MNDRPITEVDVYLHERPGDPVYVGILGTSYSGGRNLASSSFQYDRSYLERADRYALSPDLPLATTVTRTRQNTNLFGAFADAAPDAWGQKLITANNAVQRKRGLDVPLRPGDFDFLIGIADVTRMGALRLAKRGGAPRTDSRQASAQSAWLSPQSARDLEDIEKIERVARRYEAHQASDEDIEYLAGLATSPGGARPKANVTQIGQRLVLVKLPHSKDANFDVEGWEAVALTIARNAGVRTPRFETKRISADKAILLLDRFDRFTLFDGVSNVGRRRGYMSAATALEIRKHDDNTSITYEHFADTIVETSSQSRLDLREMYTRIALTVLMNNVDDHWRNHGFLRVDGGWQLAPIFDVNPSRLRGVVHSRAIDDMDDPTNRDIRNLYAIADAYRLTPDQGAQIIVGVAREVRQWPVIAR